MTNPLTYEEALAFIHGTYKLGEKDGLNNMRALLARLGNPERAFPSIHVAGTNGKGSVCALAQAALRCAGYRTGLYTSPFLERYNERMRIDGRPIADATLARIMSRVAPAVIALRAEGIRPTEFEIGTALAFCFFAEENIDMAVIEVGLGGRLDPTNVLLPRVCAVASIGLDHQHVLGDTLEAIAYEKAGIAKSGVPLVLSAQTTDAVREVVSARCAAVGAPFVMAQDDPGTPIGLPGAHQAYNAALAAEAVRRCGLPVSEEAIARGLFRARWPGRLEWALDGAVLLDGAHNPQGARSLAGFVRALAKKRTVLLCGIMRDKDWLGIVDCLSGFADAAVAVAPKLDRALAPFELAQAFMEKGVQAEPSDTVEAGLSRALALAGPGGRVVACGSLYLVGALRTLLKLPENLLLLEE